ncbi:hypothetical protein ACIGEZ_14910 [Streptomyces sp. NPDC085481]|uniref:hypothetical protein n=1 Tax=Streptomyces sp. NPDC085481 TaxID=3365727 RepID=UPI0037CF8576
MGVFAMFRRKNKEAAEAAVVTEEAPDTTPEAAEAEAAPEAAEPAATEVKADSVEIPKQQSAEEAADNEAGEGVRK